MVAQTYLRDEIAITDADSQDATWGLMQEEEARWLRACAWNDAPIAFRKIFGIGLIGKLTKFRRTQTGTTACFGDE